MTSKKRKRKPSSGSTSSRKGAGASSGRPANEGTKGSSKSSGSAATTTLSKGKQRSQTARARAKRRQLLTRLYWGGAAVVLIGVVLVLLLRAGDEGVSDATAWDLPAMGPTAEVQERVTLAEHAGKPTVVNFFASWCTACDAELPFFREISHETSEEINWVGIASQERGDAMLMPTRHAITHWSLARDINFNGLSGDLGMPRGMPLTAFYDENGELVDIIRGAVPDEEALRSRLRSLYGVGT